MAQDSQDQERQHSNARAAMEFYIRSKVAEYRRTKLRRRDRKDGIAVMLPACDRGLINELLLGMDAIKIVLMPPPFSGMSIIPPGFDPSRHGRCDADDSRQPDAWMTSASVKAES